MLRMQRRAQPFADSLDHFVAVAPTDAANAGPSLTAWTLVAVGQLPHGSEGLCPFADSLNNFVVLHDHAANGSG
jgi:hypothetical protein